MSENSNIGFATVGDSSDVKFWSGTPKHMAAALSLQGFSISHIGPLKAPSIKPYQIAARLRKALGLSRSSAFFEEVIIQQYAADYERKLQEAMPSIVFALAGSIFAWKTPQEIPLIYSSDATFRLVENYHPRYRNLSRRARDSMERVEKNTIKRADIILYPSEWAAQSAIEDYGADPKKVHIIPWGANLRHEPTREAALKPRRPGPFRMLFVGVDWVEKGASIAIETLNYLRLSGIETELVICGCTPQGSTGIDGLTVIPYLNKNDPAQLKMLTTLYLDADFFILPTKADCYGIVFCEAASYGLPSIAPATGGVPGAIIHGETGILLPEGSDAPTYAQAIIKLISDPECLRKLRVTSRSAFETKLNWQAWGEEAANLIKKV